jgi:tRNA1(Val) A37 N6-methylase TrmN6
MSKKSKISWDYQQPDFYKFSEDSIYLSKHAIGKIKGNINILDVGSGCGVIGLEIIQGTSFSPHVDFLEIQPEFRPYFEANKKYLNAFNANFILGDYSKVILGKKYDLIVSNPPYFLTGENRLGECLNKNTCRFFLNGDLDDLLSFFKKHLTKEGVGIFLCRKGQVTNNKFKIISKDNKTDLVEVLSLDI